MNCWGRVWAINQHPEQSLPAAYFLVFNGLLYIRTAANPVISWSCRATEPSP